MSLQEQKYLNRLEISLRAHWPELDIRIRNIIRQTSRTCRRCESTYWSFPRRVIYDVYISSNSLRKWDTDTNFSAFCADIKNCELRALTRAYKQAVTHDT